MKKNANSAEEKPILDNQTIINLVDYIDKTYKLHESMCQLILDVCREEPRFEYVMSIADVISERYEGFHEEFFPNN